MYIFYTEYSFCQNWNHFGTQIHLKSSQSVTRWRIWFDFFCKNVTHSYQYLLQNLSKWTFWIRVNNIRSSSSFNYLQTDHDFAGECHVRPEFSRLLEAIIIFPCLSSRAWLIASSRHSREWTECTSNFQRKFYVILHTYLVLSTRSFICL